MAPTRTNTIGLLIASNDPSQPAQRDSVDVSEYRPAKRRKVAGLNTRFNRMIKSVDTMLSHRASSPASSRKRMQSESSGTSSVSSHDIPKTPVDAYSDLHPGKLSSNFSLLKTKTSSLFPRNDAERFSIPVVPPREPKSPLPDWLADTFRSLEAGHPLRGLLSPSCLHTGSESITPTVELGAAREEEVFAFSPFDKPGDAPGAAYRPDNTLNVQERASSIIPAEPTASHLELATSINPLPFSTPGSFAPVRGPTGSSRVIDSAFQKPLAPVVQQVAYLTTNTMRPSALLASHLRSNDVIGRQFIQGFSNLIQDTEPPSDLQEISDNANHHYQVFQDGHDNLNMYVTPGPTLACSRPVYFDSPTEDPSLSDPLEPESYELGLNAIDFRWRPFLRSNGRESIVPNRATMGDQSGWSACFGVDKREHGTSNEDLPSLEDDVDTAFPDNIGVIRPSNTHATTTQLGSVGNIIGPLSSPINDMQEPEPALLAAHRVQPRGDGENIHTSEELPLLHGKETKATGSEAHGIQPSTPIRQVAVSPPSTPHKHRSSQLRDMPRASIRKTSSALSWMIPLKHSKRTNAVRYDVSVNSHDSIESWSETS